MDEEQKNNIMETKSTPDTPSPLPLTWRDGAIPLLALALSWMFWACFAPENTGFPHLGVLALVCAHFAAVFIVLGRRARLSAGSVLLTAAALALGVSCALYDADVFLVLSCFVILLTAAMGTFALAGRLAPGRPTAIPGTVRLAFAAFFTRLDRPFRVLAQTLRSSDRRRLGTGLLAVLIALPVLAVVLWLLASADAVFSSLFTGVALPRLSEDTVMETLRLLVLALFLCSALYFIREDAPEKATAGAGKPRSAVLFLPVTALLDIVYIIFCIVQFRYLFGGAETASMSGGWAEYARSGFFQLVTITAINLGLFLLAAVPGRFGDRDGKLLRALLGLLLALTAVILFSAFWRMRLYILTYGMSVLRLLTLWAMAVIGFGLLAAFRKLARPGFGFFRVMGSFALALWCVLCLAGPCGLIARYNADGYLSGRLEQVDTVYLRELGRDALPALRKLDEAGEPGCGELIQLLEPDDAHPLPWPQWRLRG